MTSVIRIDNEVMDELKKRAIDFGLVFEPPNATLRKILKLDVEETSIVVKQEDVSKLNQNPRNRRDAIYSHIEGWPKALMDCIEQINKTEFSTEDVYKFEKELKVKYPKNQNIKAAIRGTLQILRDKGLIEFIAHGEYKIKYS